MSTAICGERFSNSSDEIGSDVAVKAKAKTENKIFRQLIHELSEMKNLCISLNEQSYLEIITSNPVDFVRNAVVNFRSRFNEYFGRNIFFFYDIQFLFCEIFIWSVDTWLIQDIKIHSFEIE